MAAHLTKELAAAPNTINSIWLSSRVCSDPDRSHPFGSSNVCVLRRGCRTWSGVVVQNVQHACLAFRRALLHPARGAWGNVTIKFDEHPDVFGLRLSPNLEPDEQREFWCKILPSLLVLSSWLRARQPGPPPPPRPPRLSPRCTPCAPEACMYAVPWHSWRHV